MSGAAFLAKLSQLSLQQTLFERRNAIAVVGITPDLDTGYDIRAILAARSAILEDPLGDNTSICIQQLWQNMDRIAHFEIHQTIKLSICRQITISSNVLAWQWFDLLERAIADAWQI
jgi:hypothetical protein